MVREMRNLHTGWAINNLKQAITREEGALLKVEVLVGGTRRLALLKKNLWELT